MDFYYVVLSFCGSQHSALASLVWSPFLPFLVITGSLAASKHNTTQQTLTPKWCWARKIKKNIESFFDIWWNPASWELYHWLAIFLIWAGEPLFEFWFFFFLLVWVNHWVLCVAFSSLGFFPDGVMNWNQKLIEILLDWLFWLWLDLDQLWLQGFDTLIHLMSSSSCCSFFFFLFMDLERKFSRYWVDPGV